MHISNGVVNPKIRINEIPKVKEEVAKVMCLLEIHFSLFDMQVHLVIHLVREVELAGVVQAHWLCFIHRYMKEFKGFVRQHAPTWKRLFVIGQSTLQS